MDAVVGRQDLGGTGILEAGDMHANLGAAALVEHAVRRGEGRLSADGALIVQTGVHTGRSVQDKFVVDEPETTVDIWWGAVNRKLAPANFTRLCDGVRGHLQGRTLFTQDLYAGAAIRRIGCAVRIVTTNAWHALFARNIFIRTPAEDLIDGFEPDYVILHAPELCGGSLRGVRRALRAPPSHSPSRRSSIVIAGTEYAGEIKKSIFTVMNFDVSPARACCRCIARPTSAPEGDTALFFGLSGTGKTTLSSDPARAS